MNNYTEKENNLWIWKLLQWKEKRIEKKKKKKKRQRHTALKKAMILGIER